MTTADVWELVKNGGPPVILLLMIAIGWLLVDRKRLLESLSSKDDVIALKSEKLESLSERFLVTITKIETFLFASGRQL